MPFIDKECEGPGATHSHACACREARFRKLEAKLKDAEEALEYYGDVLKARCRMKEHDDGVRAREALAELRNS